MIVIPKQDSATPVPAAVSSQSVSHDGNELTKLALIKRGNTGRNERCPCGSGKKYKNCHGA